jgi:hypothetical protein
VADNGVVASSRWISQLPSKAEEGVRLDSVPNSSYGNGRPRVISTNDIFTWTTDDTPA